MYNLISTLKNLPSLVGCKDFPNDTQGMALLKDIQDFLNKHSPIQGGNLREAFELAAARKLLLNGKLIEPDTFGQHLSVNIVGKVVAAYNEYKRNERSRPQRGLPEFESDDRITDKESFEFYEKWTNHDGKVPTFAPFWGAYNYMVKEDIIKPVKENNIAVRRTLGNLEYIEKISSRQHVVEKHFTP